MEKVEKGAGFDEANGFSVREKVESDFGRDATVEKNIFCGPSFVDGAFVDFTGARIFFEKLWSDEVGFTRVGEREERARAWDHAMALVL